MGPRSPVRRRRPAGTAAFAHRAHAATDAGPTFRPGAATRSDPRLARSAPDGRIADRPDAVPGRQRTDLAAHVPGRPGHGRAGPPRGCAARTWHGSRPMKIRRRLIAT